MREMFKALDEVLRENPEVGAITRRSDFLFGKTEWRVSRSHAG